MRKRVRKARDRKIFTRTAKLTHKKNLLKLAHRGGICQWDAENMEEDVRDINMNIDYIKRLCKIEKKYNNQENLTLMQIQHKKAKELEYKN